MVVRFSLQKQENGSNSPNASGIESYCELYAKQLTHHYQSCCVRIVYHHSISKKHQEVVKYAENQLPFSPQNLAYLRSETWLKDFPHVFEVQEFKHIEFTNYVFYVCPIGYKNQQPEYIQIITNKPLAVNLQTSLRGCLKSRVCCKKALSVYAVNR
ncbi:MAG: hypothetical protein ACHBN1_37775 [Heteroscytonema crispum UTEX LB 1556]